MEREKEENSLGMIERKGKVRWEGNEYEVDKDNKVWIDGREYEIGDMKLCECCMSMDKIVILNKEEEGDNFTICDNIHCKAWRMNVGMKKELRYGGKIEDLDIGEIYLRNNKNGIMITDYRGLRIYPICKNMNGYSLEDDMIEYNKEGMRHIMRVILNKLSMEDYEMNYMEDMRIWKHIENFKELIKRRMNI